jgi:hypothetical protein
MAAAGRTLEARVEKAARAILDTMEAIAWAEGLCAAVVTWDVIYGAKSLLRPLDRFRLPLT